MTLEKPKLIDKRLRTPAEVMVLVDGQFIPADKVRTPCRQYGNMPKTKVKAVPSSWREQSRNRYANGVAKTTPQAKAKAIHQQNDRLEELKDSIALKKLRLDLS